MPMAPVGAEPKASLAALAQLGERQTEDLKVPGSIPGGGTFWIHITLALQQLSYIGAVGVGVIIDASQALDPSSNLGRRRSLCG